MSDSVGKISLDLEIQSDISKQISDTSNMVGNNLKKSLNNSMKSTLENVNSSIKKTMNNITSNINSSMKRSMSNVAKNMKSILSNIKMPKMNIPKPTSFSTPKSVETETNVSKRGPPALELENLTNAKLGKIQELDTTERQIENLRNKLKSLNEQLSNTFNKKSRNKLEAQILSTESRMNSLINKSIKLVAEVIDLDIKIDKLGKSTNSTNASLNNTSNITNKANNALKSHSSSIGTIIKSMFTWSIVMPTILKGLSAMATGLFNNLKTNEQFSNSLAQIRSNLMIAFTPIYEAILPAINALMSALSIATQYIASFISAIFGKTYEQSKQATQGLIDAKNAMGVYGDSAKAAGEAAKDALGLASFDEINTLNSNDSSSGSGSGGGGSSIPQLVTPALDTTSVDSAMKNLVDKIKAYFSTFNFEPLIQSFNRLKKAVEPIIKNLGKIIKWFLTDILDPLAHWTISDLLPAFLNLVAGALEVLNPILEVFMDAGKWLWDNILQPIASWTGGIIVDVLNSLADALGKIGNWIDEHKETLSKVVKFIGTVAAVLGILELAIWGVGIVIGILTSPITLVIGAIVALIAIFTQLYDSCEGFREFVDTVVEFGKNLILGLLEGIASVMSTIGSWLKDNVVDPILKAVKGFFGIHSPSKVFAEIGVFLMEGLLEGIKSLKERIITFFSNFCTNLKEIFTNIFKWFVDKFVEAKEKLNDFKVKVLEIWDEIKSKFDEFKNWLGNVFATDWSKRFGFFGDILNGYLANVRNTFNSVKRIFSGIIDFIAGVFTGNWSRAWQGVVNIFKGIMDGLGAVIKAPLNAVISLINGAISGINKISVDIPDWVPSWAGGGKHFGVNIPSIPYLAKGGIIDSPTLAMVGEAGKEAVVPLENNTQGLDLLASKLMERLGGTNISSGEKDRAIQIILKLGDIEFARVLIDSINKLTEMNNGECLINL